MTIQNENVDEAEIAKFNRMASRWWDPSGDFKPLHDMNPVRANYIDQRSPIAEKTVLDIGCGGGILTEALAQRGAIVTGIDLSPGPLEVAKLHKLESGLEIDYRMVSAETLAEDEPENYDIVTCLEMLEHVPDPQSVVKACADLCKKGGDIYFSTINRNIKAYCMAVIGAEYVLKLLPKGTHEYKKFIRPSELASWSRNAGLVVKSVNGIVYNPFTKTFKINEHDVDVNYIVHATKP